jgi:hypothetical protein
VLWRATGTGASRSAAAHLQGLHRLVEGVHVACRQVQVVVRLAGGLRGRLGARLLQRLLPLHLLLLLQLPCLQHGTSGGAHCWQLQNCACGGIGWWDPPGLPASRCLERLPECIAALQKGSGHHLGRGVQWCSAHYHSNSLSMRAACGVYPLAGPQGSQGIVVCRVSI